MATFLVVSGRVPLSTAAVVATDTYRGGVLVDATAESNKGASSGVAQFSNGLVRNNDGAVVFYDATAGLPADIQWCNGLPLRADGSLCVSTGEVAYFSNGIPFAANGAVAAETGATPEQYVIAPQEITLSADQIAIGQACYVSKVTCVSNTGATSVILWDHPTSASGTQTISTGVMTAGQEITYPDNDGLGRIFLMGCYFDLTGTGTFDLEVSNVV